MMRRLIAIAAFSGMLGASVAAHAANLALYTDPRFVDESVSGEPLILRRCLADSLGHTITNFTGTSDGEWTAALAGADILVIPELEDPGSLADSLSAATRAAVRTFVQTQGRGLVICGDFLGNAPRFLNSVFSFAIQTGSVVSTASTSTLQVTAAAGTAFEQGLGAPSLVNASATEVLKASTLPAGALTLYLMDTSADSAAVSAMTSGQGRIVHLGYDWFGTPSSEWVNVLGSAILHAANPEPIRVAFFADSTFADLDDEALKMHLQLTSAGHTVTDFSGTVAATWEANLRDTEVLAISELQGDLLASLPADTRTVLSRYLMSGGGLVLSGDASGRGLGLLNGILGFSLASGANGLAGTLNAGGAAGTPFAAGPTVVPPTSLVSSATTASLPAGSAALYTNGVNSIAFRTGRGLGRIVFLGFDYFTFSPAPFAWRSALEHAVQFTAGPPDLAISAPAVAPGATAQVMADLSGFFGLSTANLRFRAGGDAAFLTVPLVQSAPTVWSATIPGSSVTTRGVQFFLDLGDATRAGTSPVLANGTNAHDLPVTLSNFEVASLGAGGYSLRGIPMQAASTAPEAIFDELGAYNVKKWRYGTFNGSGYSEPGGGARNAVPGQGFWIIARDATSIAASGTTTSLARPVEITLAPGFNQIANPFNFPVDFTALIRPAGVEANLIGFDGSGYVNGVGTLQPGQGYWIRNNAASALTLGIPPLGQGVAPAPPAIAAVDAAPAQMALRLDASAGTFTDRGNVLGLRDGAAAGRDAFDLSEPPPAPAGWVRLGFASATDGDLLADWRPAGSDGDTWEVTLASDQSGQPFVVRIVPEQDLPEGWDVTVFEGAREVVLGPDQTITGTVGYTTAPRRFTVSVGSPSYLGSVRTEAQRDVTEFALGSPFPNPAYAASGVSVDLALPQAVDRASVQVYDVNGRLVRTLLNGPVAAGVQRVAWDGRDQAGNRTAAGVYFVKSRAAGFSATRKVVLLP